MDKSRHSLKRQNTIEENLTTEGTLPETDSKDRDDECSQLKVQTHHSYVSNNNTNTATNDCRNTKNNNGGGPSNQKNDKISSDSKNNNYDNTNNKKEKNKEIKRSSSKVKKRSNKDTIKTITTPPPQVPRKSLYNTKNGNISTKSFEDDCSLLNCLTSTWQSMNQADEKEQKYRLPHEFTKKRCY
mmetsp:Transcript_3877/g.4223  ORF Transcript_3877/g.4223 Transcript_3877/m.4223 type:complete len:185 (-) Transcript_3877:8-562(-)